MNANVEDRALTLANGPADKVGETAMSPAVGTCGNEYNDAYYTKPETPATLAPPGFPDEQSYSSKEVLQPQTKKVVSPDYGVRGTTFR